MPVDLVDGDLQPALDRLAGGGRAAGDRGGEPDLHRLLGLGERRAGHGHGEERGEHQGKTSHANPPWSYDFGGVIPYAFSLRYRWLRSIPSFSAVRVMFHSWARSSPRMYARSNASRASLSVRSRCASSPVVGSSRVRSGGGRFSGPITSRGAMITSRSTMLRSSRTLPGQS